MTFSMNIILEGFSDTAVNVFGVYFKIQSFVFMPVFGLNSGLIPIMAYNYGAGKYDRVLKVFWQTVMWATITTTLGFLVGQLTPEFAVRLFTNEPNMIDIAAKGFSIAMTAFPIVGLSMVVGNFFQSIGMAGKAIFLSLSRQVLFLIPSLVVVPMFFGIKGVWLAMPISDTIATIVAAVMMLSLIRKFKTAPQTIGFKGVEDDK